MRKTPVQGRKPPPRTPRVKHPRANPLLMVVMVLFFVFSCVLTLSSAQLAEAKITLDLDVLESGAYVDKWIAADFEAAVALNGGRPDPDGSYSRYFTSTGNLNKVAGYSSPELDKLFAEGRQTSDLAKRKEIYTQISNNLENNAAWIWMFTSYTYTATTSKVAGFTPMANSSLQYLRETTLG